MAAAKSFAEIGRIEAIQQLFEGTPYRPFEEPCWFEAKAHSAVTTATKVLSEGIDFDLKFFPLKHLGYKAVASVTGELYAVMAHPRVLSVTLSISAKLDYPQAEEIWQGVVAAAKEHGYAHVSLDLRPSRTGLLLAVSASGECSQITSKRRPKAKSMDLICVSGRLGAAYLGQRVLENKFQELEKYKMMVGAYLKPEISPSTLSQMENEEIYPSHGYLVSAGLSDTIMRLCRDSGLGAKIYADKIPFEGNTFSLAKELDVDPISAAMNGGEDNILLFTIPILQLDKFRHDFQTFNIIGHLAQQEVGAVLVTPDGVELPLKAQGYEKSVETE